MNKTVGMFCKLAVGSLFVAVAAAAQGCGGEVAVQPQPVYAEAYPTDAYIATAAPVYYEGRPAYWYGNRWYYRDGGRWSYYSNEPAYLYARRGYGYSYRGSVRYNVRRGYYR
jgi:hypothetical protein